MLLNLPEPMRAAPPPPGSFVGPGHDRVVRAVVAGLLRVPLGHPDVDDVVQEAARRALESPPPAGVPNVAWWTGIAKHVALDRARQRRRQGARQTTETPSSPEVSDVVASNDPLPDARLLRLEDKERVLRALSEMPATTRRVLELFYLEGKPYGAIAKELGVPVGTVATWLLRGKKAMAVVLTPDGEQ
jgi:RNA polymerase sigma-70 factor (ECF subfamily)